MAVKLVRSDGKGVPCGDGYMSEGDTCHAGEGTAGKGGAKKPAGGGRKPAPEVAKAMESLSSTGAMGRALEPDKEPGIARKIAAEVVAQTTNDVLFDGVGIGASVLTGNPLPLLATTAARYLKPGQKTGQAIRSQLGKRIGSRGFDSKRARIAVNLGGKAVMGGLMMAAFAQSSKPSREYSDELARNSGLRKGEQELASLFQMQDSKLDRKRAESHARQSSYALWQLEREMEKKYGKRGRGKRQDSLERFDKACGNSYIGDNEECHVGKGDPPGGDKAAIATSSKSGSPSRGKGRLGGIAKVALGAAVVAGAGAGAAAIAQKTSQGKASAEFFTKNKKSMEKAILEQPAIAAALEKLPELPGKKPGFGKKLVAEVGAQLGTDMVFSVFSNLAGGVAGGVTEAAAGKQKGDAVGNATRLVTSLVARYSPLGKAVEGRFRDRFKEKLGTGGFESKTGRRLTALGITAAKVGVGVAILATIQKQQQAQAGAGAGSGYNPYAWSRPSDWKDFEDEISKDAERKANYETASRTARAQAGNDPAVEETVRRTFYTNWKSEKTGGASTRGKSPAASNWSSTLGVSKNATKEEVKKAFRTIAKQSHPDVNPGDPQAAEKFRRAQEAYEAAMSRFDARFDSLDDNWLRIVLREIKRDAEVRFDKACGNSFIGDDEECHVSTGAQNSSQRKRRKGGVGKALLGAALVAGAGAGAIAAHRASQSPNTKNSSSPSMGSTPPSIAGKNRKKKSLAKKIAIGVASAAVGGLVAANAQPALLKSMDKIRNARTGGGSESQREKDQFEKELQSGMHDGEYQKLKDSMKRTFPELEFDEEDYRENYFEIWRSKRQRRDARSDSYSDAYTEGYVQTRLARQDDGYLVFFEGRRTGIAVDASSPAEAEAKARKLKKRGGDGVVKVRKASPQEVSTAAKGRWIRSGPNGEPAGYDKGKRGYGPAPKSRSDSKKPAARQ